MLFLSCCRFHLQKSLSTSQSPESTSHHLHHYYPGTHRQMVLNSILATNVSTSLSNTHTTASSLTKQKLEASVTSLLKTVAPTCFKEKPKSHSCLPGPTDRAPHALNLPSSNHRTGFLRGGRQVPRSREPASRLPILSPVLTARTPRGPQAYLQPLQSLSSTTAGSHSPQQQTRSAGNEAPQVREAQAGSQGAPRYPDGGQR